MERRREFVSEFSAVLFANAGCELFNLLEKHSDLEEKAIAKAKAMLESDDHDIETILVSAIAHLIYLVAMGQAVEGERGEVAA